MNATLAIALARHSVSIHGSRTNWTVIGPYNEVGGPYTEVSRDSYAAAARLAANWKLQLALTLVGCPGDEAMWIAEDRVGPWQPLVRAYVRDQKLVASMG